VLALALWESEQSGEDAKWFLGGGGSRTYNPAVLRKLRYVGVLVVLSARDLASGAVELGRLATHLGAVAGLVLVYALYVSERATPPPASATVGTDQPDEPGRGLRGVA